MPFRDFKGPARRRTDHPLVVGTIVLCLGVMTVSSILLIVATLWAGSQAKEMIEQSRKREQAATVMREGLAKNAESQALVLRRLCLNLSQSARDKEDCRILAPPIHLKDTSGSP